MSFKIYSPHFYYNDNRNQFVDKVEESDFLFLKFKIRSKQTGIKYVNETNVPIVKEMRDFAVQSQKKLIYLCAGDIPPTILPNDEHTIVFKTSIYRNQRYSNEYAFGVSVDDRFQGHYLENPDMSIGFVGHANSIRQGYLFLLEKSTIHTDFILNPNYFFERKQSPEEKKQKIDQFYENIDRNLFTFCCRGRGNFSTRFYETLMMGRIPILMNTDCVMPYEDIIDYGSTCVWVEPTDNLEEKIKMWYEHHKDQLFEIQKKNRKLYETYFSHGSLFPTFFEYVFKKFIQKSL